MATKITPKAKEEILEALEEMELENGDRWADENWYDDECKILDKQLEMNPYDYCPECGDGFYLRGYFCNSCGFPHSHGSTSLIDWIDSVEFYF